MQGILILILVSVIMFILVCSLILGYLQKKQKKLIH